MVGLKQIRNVSRTIAKGSLYLAGAGAIGWPLVRTGLEVWRGVPLENAVKTGIYVGTGYNATTSKLETPMLRDAAIRTGAGAFAIYVARKI